MKQFNVGDMVIVNSGMFSEGIGLVENNPNPNTNFIAVRIKSFTSTQLDAKQLNRVLYFLPHELELIDNKKTSVQKSKPLTPQVKNAYHRDIQTMTQLMDHVFNTYPEPQAVHILESCFKISHSKLNKDVG